jgi:carbon storage regulator
MLIIARRSGESIWIGEDIEIKIVDLTPSRVKVGLEAPRQLEIRRGEAKEAGEHNRVASATDPGTAERLVNEFRFFSYTKAPRR